ncbi:MAG TPA: PaaI family thioesterase [Actinomycetota bacterium]|nr:PaaI family thioesterase [Actinomycetota bacterium]
MADDNPLPPGATREAALRMASEASRGTMMERIGVEWLDVGTARVVARIPVAGNTQVYGQLHGGATAALCESVGSIGTAVVAGLDKRVVGIQLSINHIRAVRDGHVIATGVPLHVGRSTAVWDMRVEDDEGRLVAAGRLTLSVREA